MVNTVNILKAGTLNIEGTQTLGINLLETILKDAFLVFTSASVKFDIYDRYRIRNSVLFIQGSGLESIIQTFGLEYNPNLLRENFFDLCYQNIKKPQKSQ